MKVQDVINNFRGTSSKLSCPWDIILIRKECLHFWEEGNGKSNVEKVCNNNRDCSLCRSMDSNKFISVTNLLEKNNVKKTALKRR